MSYKYSSTVPSTYANNSYQWVILLTIVGDQPIQQFIEFKEKELAERFVTTANVYSKHVALRLYDHTSDKQKIDPNVEKLIDL